MLAGCGVTSYSLRKGMIIVCHFFNHGGGFKSMEQEAVAAAPFAKNLGVPVLDYDIAPGVVDDGENGSFLFVHGFGGNKLQLRPLGDGLCSVNATAIYPSMRGNGNSPAPEWGYSCLDFTADLHRLADSFPQRLNLVGYSLGALVGAISALTWGASQITSIVMIDQSFAAHPDRMVNDAQAEGRFLRWHYDFTQLLTVMRIPVLFLVARDSHMVESEELNFLRGRADSRFVLDEIAGTHVTCIDDPEALVKRIRSFYADVLVYQQ